MYSCVEHFHEVEINGDVCVCAFAWHRRLVHLLMRLAAHMHAHRGAGFWDLNWQVVCGMDMCAGVLAWLVVQG